MVELQLCTEPQIGASDDTSMKVPLAVEALGFALSFHPGRSLGTRGNDRERPDDAWTIHAGLGPDVGGFTRKNAVYDIPSPAIGERSDRPDEQLAIVRGLPGTPLGQTPSHQGSQG